MLLLPLRLDLAPHLVHRLILYFNPRTPVGCDMRYHSITPVRCNFNPRTPVGCNQRHQSPVRNLGISIHAPQWGATSPAMYRLSPFRFQSTHPSGVRPAVWLQERGVIKFQSTHPVGYDHIRITQGDGVLISIHAPQWGATVALRCGGYAGLISIHAPQWGATSPCFSPSSCSRYFNPRAPVGCDKTTRATRGWRCNFNPRTP